MSGPCHGGIKGVYFYFILKAPLSFLSCTPPPKEELSTVLAWRTQFRLEFKNGLWDGHLICENICQWILGGEKAV